MSSGSPVGMLGWTPLQRGRIVSWTRGQVRVRLTGFDPGPKAWVATAPGISACGPSPEAAVYTLRERALRALDATK